MDFVLLIMFLTAVFIVSSLRSARLVVRRRLSFTTVLFYNLSFFVIQGCVSLALEKDLAILSLAGCGVVSIIAAYIFLAFKKRKHNPHSLTQASVDNDDTELNVSGFRHEAMIKRQLYCDWFKGYILQIIFLVIFVLLFRVSV